MKKLNAIAIATVLGFSLTFAQETTQEVPAPEQPQAQQKAKRASRQPDQQKQANRRAKMIAKRTQKINEGTAEIIAAYDQDKDGTLNDQEKANMLASFEAAKQTLKLAHRYQMVQKIDGNGDLVITEEEMEAKFDDMQQAFRNRAQNGRRGMQRGQHNN